MAHLVTTLGPKALADLGPILPHEHVSVDLRTWDQPGYGEADPVDVVRLMAPELERARAAGVAAIVEPSTVGVGRRADLLLAVSRATGFPLVAPTGAYREPWLPPWVRDAAEDALRDWMIGELSGRIVEVDPRTGPLASPADDGPAAGSNDVRAGWIKLGASDEGLTPAEAKLLRAAAAASRATGAAVGSHTLVGAVARAQLDLFEEAGADPARFVWVHAHREPDVAIHHELGRRGAWIEYDGIGDPGTDDRFLDLVLRALDAGLGDRLLLSHDRGWYDPAQPGGGTPRPFTPLFAEFLPRLAAAGVDPATRDRLTRRNPFAAFAR